MNEYNEMIQALSDQLRVPIEVLWKTLLIQAPISATAQIVMFMVSVVGLYLSFRYLIRAAKNRVDVDILFVVWVVLAAVMGILLFSSLEHIIAAFFNPEYWALMQILNPKG